MIQRWELLGAPKFNKEADVQQDLEHWHKLNSDLSDVTSWLGRVLPELESLQRISPSTRIGDFEVNIQRLKVEFLLQLVSGSARSHWLNDTVGGVSAVKWAQQYYK